MFDLSACHKLNLLNLPMNKSSFPVWVVVWNLKLASFVGLQQLGVCRLYREYPEFNLWVVIPVGCPRRLLKGLGHVPNLSQACDCRISQYPWFQKNFLMVHVLFTQIHMQQGSKVQQFSGRHLIQTNHGLSHQPGFKQKPIPFHHQNHLLSIKTLCHQLILQVPSTLGLLYLM